MKKSFYIILISVVALSLGGCDTVKSLHSKYQSQATVPADVFGLGSGVALDSTSIADISWREFFIDPLLQRLIDTALVHNTDINSARIAIQQSEASLAAAKQAFFPSVVLAPSGSVGSFGGSKAKLTVLGEIWTSLLSAQPLASPEMGGLRWGWGAWPVMPLGGPLCKGGGEYWVGGTGEGYSSPGTRTEGKGGFSPFFPGVFGDRASNGERIN